MVGEPLHHSPPDLGSGRCTLLIAADFSTMVAGDISGTNPSAIEAVSLRGILMNGCLACDSYLVASSLRQQWTNVEF